MAGQNAAKESEKEMFANWIQSLLGLDITKTALHSYVENKWEKHVNNTERRFKCEIRPFLCDIGDGKYKQNKRKWVMQCGHDTCQRFMDSLVLKERKPGCLTLSAELCKNVQNIASPQATGSHPSHDKSNEARRTHIWCLANMFMQHGSAESAFYVKGPEETDASLFFKMMRNCKLFEFDGCDEIYENIMETRTKLHHSPTHLLPKEEAIMFFERMERLLKAIKEPDCVIAIQKITEMKESTRKMICVPDEVFQENAKYALQLHEKEILAEIQNEKSKGHTTDNLERSLKDTRDEIENLNTKTQPVKYGLKSRKQLKKENQEYRETVKEMEVIVDKMKELKQKTSEVKTKTRMIMNVKSASGVNLADFLVNKVMGMDPTEAKRCLINICSNIPRDLTCLTKDTTKQVCTCGRCICQKDDASCKTELEIK